MHLTRIQQLATPLRESIIDKPPYISGSRPLPDSSFSLFYKTTKDGHAAGHIDLANATLDELEGLAQAYLAQTDLIKIIREDLLEGTQSTRIVRTELSKLNVYGKGSFFKPTVNTLCSEKMFGSLVIIFPTSHEGGTLLLRHRGNEWAFDSGRGLADVRQPSIGYVAFFSDIEHGVAPVISGHRVTLTYNLYFDDAFEALLENPELLTDGGTLIFGLRHIYPIEDHLGSVYKALKGSDAMLYQSVLALGFEPVLHMYYQWDYSNIGHLGGVLVKEVINFDNWEVDEDEEDFDRTSLFREKGRIIVHQEYQRPDKEVQNSDQEDQRWYENFADEHLGPVVWVTPMMTFNRRKSKSLLHMIPR
ncbi:hypothetical protein BJV74DRAFT_885855 [Russula compacta]|nr:hypothetical protein BJV74DRAFT_885855 [Russula compacta]